MGLAPARPNKALLSLTEFSAKADLPLLSIEIVLKRRNYRLKPWLVCWLASTLTSPCTTETAFATTSLMTSDSQELMEFQEEEAAALLAAISNSHALPAEGYMELDVPCENSRRLSPSLPATTGQACRRGSRSITKTETRSTTKTETRSFEEQLVEPAWWETELASSIHQTLRERASEREAAIGDIQFRSPQLEQM